MKGRVKDFFFSYFDRETRVEIVLEGNQCDALEKLEGIDVEVVLTACAKAGRKMAQAG